MEDLSLHIIDVVENSLRARATRVSIRFIENPAERTLTLEIEDNGHGMDEETARGVVNPFFTTKEGKRFGLGVALLAQAAEETGGRLTVESAEGVGTKVTALFRTDSIDMKPLGDIGGTLRILTVTNPDVEIEFDVIDLSEQP